MCARMTITTTPKEIADLFGLAADTQTDAEKGRYNVAPSTLIPVVRVTNGIRELVHLKWGLVPHWNSDPKPSGFVNARAETAAEKPTFRDPFRRRRCLVPASGFFEWKAVGKKKQPYLVRPARGGLFAYAGVWDRWEGPNGAVETVAVLTVSANDLILPLHDRMPGIIPPERFAEWLDPKVTAPAKLMPLLQPYPAERMEMWAVSDRVNKVAADDAELLKPVKEVAPPRPVQQSLFDL